MNIRNIARTLAIAVIAISAAACTRIETGEVGLRVGFDKQVQMEELQPGKLAQTVVGDVLTFPVRDISGSLDNKTPVTKPQTTKEGESATGVHMKAVDVSYVYSLNPSAVAELWTSRSKSFHVKDEKTGDIFLMANRMNVIVNNALYDSVRNYDVRVINEKRADIERDIMQKVADTLKADKLDGSLTLTSVQVRELSIPDSIRESAARVVASANELAVMENQVALANKEAERMQALSKNSGQSIAYMDAQARLNISEAVKAGKVSTIVIPHDFKGIVNVK